MPEPQIRPAHLSDLDAIVALEEAVFSGDRLSRRSLRAFIQSSRQPLLVAICDDRLAGYALVVLRQGTGTARIYSIAVDPAFGRRGIGRALLSACEHYARRHGRQALRLEVRHDNSAAIALYERLNYRRFGRRENYYDDGAAALRLEKPVRAGAAR
jgi:[ribosomal protein S18]-alanine N-acetyltransferase